MPSTILGMRSPLHLIAVAAAFFAWPAHAQEKWESVAEVSAVSIEIKRVTSSELADLQRRYVPGARADLRELRHDHRDGLALLFKNNETGAHRCVVYISEEVRGTTHLVEVIGHEMTHCAGFTH